MEQTHHSRLMLAVLAVVLLGASIVGYFVSQNVRQKNPSGEMTQITIVPTVMPTLIPYPTNGQFTFKVREGQGALKQGVPFVLDLYATSGKDTVAGYDVVLSYDTQVFERQSVQNTAESFRIFNYNRGNHVSISASKNIQVSDAIKFSNTPILSFTFLPKAKGTFVFTLKPQGNESSKLVNESAEVTYPETKDISLEIN
ncbi:MAG: hypothetical protein WAV29_04140 [Microgenomates group bacterium]